MAEAFDYAAFKELASELIEAAGKSATLKRGTVEGQGRHCTKTYTNTTVTVVESNHEDAQGLSSTDGANVGERMLSFIMSASAGVEPQVADILVLPDGTEVGITEVRPLKPGGTEILYEVMGQV